MHQITLRKAAFRKVRGLSLLPLDELSHTEGPRYTALHGPQCSREILGQGLETADAAKAICEAHRQKNPGAT